MCGILGVVTKQPADLSESRIVSALKLLSHRGPDASEHKVYRLQNGRVFGTGHVRLSIIDLNDRANQPFISSNGSVLTFNGEVYNYIELRSELQGLGYRFHTTSDTEVVCYAIEEWGPAAFTKFNGMWALCYYNEAKNLLILCRDRFGIKPLYYRISKDELQFSSEIKGVLGLAQTKFKVNRRTAYAYLTQYLVDHSLETFFEGIEQFPPGHYAQLDLSQQNTSLEPRRFWSYPTQIATIKHTDLDWAADLRSRLLKAVELQLRSDAPVGLALSGGVDSSVLAACTKILGASVPAFSVVTSAKGYSEERFADSCARHLGLKQYKINVDINPQEFYARLRELIWINDEPPVTFSGVIYGLMMARVRSEGIKVILSGQGSDELFLGYRKYVPFHLMELYNNKNYRSLTKELLLRSIDPAFLRQLKLNDAMRYLPLNLVKKSLSAVSDQLQNDFSPINLGMKNKSLFDRQIQDLASTSVPSLLHYEDRMSMSQSVEVRVPYLDHTLAEHALTLPPSLKIKDGWSKWILRQAFSADLPNELIWRKDKMGFNVPQELWLKSEMQKTVEKIFSSPMNLNRLGFVDQSKLKSIYQRYCQTNGEKFIPYRSIFGPLALEAWTEKFKEWLIV